jgi:hypothetical protein
LKGIHGGGAAYAAHNLFGARTGVGEGATGKTYALPTCSAPGTPLSLDEIKDHVETFIDYAAGHSQNTFLVTAVGCGIAGFNVEEIAPLFADAANYPNIWLPESFWKVID